MSPPEKFFLATSDAGGSVAVGAPSTAQRGKRLEVLAVVQVRLQMDPIFRQTEEHHDDRWKEFSRRMLFMGFKRSPEMCHAEVDGLLQKHRQAKSEAGAGFAVGLDGDKDKDFEDLKEIEADLQRSAPPVEPTIQADAAAPAPVERDPAITSSQRALVVHEAVDDAPGRRVGIRGVSQWTKTACNALVLVRFEMNSQWPDGAGIDESWEQVSQRMRRIGYQKTALECRDKWYSLTSYYKRPAATGDMASSKFLELLPHAGGL